MAAKEPIVTGGVEILFGMRGLCNYSCDYCIAQYGPHQQKPVLYDLAWLEQLLVTSAARGDGFIVSSLECANSEPTVHPQFPNILDLLTRFGAVSTPTNNSIPIYRWLPTYPERLSVRAALHPQGEQHLDKFIGRAKRMEDVGVDVTVIYVLHPNRVERAKGHMERFAEEGLSFLPQAFHGEYQGKHYPAEHSAEERELLGMDQASTYWYHRLHLEMTIRDFQGIPCVAGWRSLHVSPPHNLRRCTHDLQLLEEPYREAVSCPVSKCGTCGLWLEEVNTLTPWFWNGWRRLAGWPELPAPPVDNDAEYRTRLAIYWDLMDRYGKIQLEDERGA
jgi:hypothetical protein